MGMTEVVATDYAAGTAWDQEIERYRVELTGYCYRMLGSAFEADDAVQETMVRAWRARDRFDGQALRPWLYRIATNVCLTALSRRQRRPRPVDPEATTVWPIPDGMVMPVAEDPSELAVSRETIRLAFVTALQLLRPRPRAVLILRDVLRWSAKEVAELLETSVASVNSTLQRARATLAANRSVPGPSATNVATEPLDPGDQEQRELLARYVTAFERFDIESLVTLLHADATMDMPPMPLWLQGRLDICRFWLEEGVACQGTKLVPTVANGSPAFALYRPSGPGGSYEPFAVQVVEVAAGRIASIRTFIDPTLVALFDLPVPAYA
jgi:RNA polymerase sigma-70 factor (ECF subfamily)